MTCQRTVFTALLNARLPPFWSLEKEVAARNGDKLPALFPQLVEKGRIVRDVLPVFQFLPVDPAWQELGLAFHLPPGIAQRHAQVLPLEVRPVLHCPLLQNFLHHSRLLISCQYSIPDSRQAEGFVQGRVRKMRQKTTGRSVDDIRDFQNAWDRGVTDDELYALYNFKPYKGVHRP